MLTRFAAVLSRAAVWSSDSLARQATHAHHCTRRFYSAAQTSAVPVHGVVAIAGQSSTSLTWPNAATTAFDNQFLLDHCRCPKCFHPQTKQRLKTLSQFPRHPVVRAVESTGDSIRISWDTPDLHESTFPLAFLQRVAYDPPLESHTTDDERILWNRRIAATPPSVECEQIMMEDTRERGIVRLLDQVHDFGFCFVTGVPATPEATEEVIRTIAPIRDTHYGGFWDFTANMSHGDLAYSAEPLPAHTDTTYFSDPAGLQIFHMLSHPPPGQGGMSLLVDGFYVASLLKTLHPEHYNTLARLAVPAHASGTAGTLLRPPISQPVLVHDQAGQLAQVRWNNEDRGALGRHWTPEDLRAWYTAAREYERLIRSEDAEYWMALQPGTMLVIDNWRVMHGRSAFTGSRRMCGAYVGADDWRSRRSAMKQGSLDIWDAGF